MQGRVCFRKASERLKKLCVVEWRGTMFCVVGLSKYWENNYTIARIAELLIVSVSIVARAYIRVHENIDDEMKCYCSVERFWSFCC